MKHYKIFWFLSFLVLTLAVTGIFGFLGWFPVYSNFEWNSEKYNELVNLIVVTNTKEFIYSDKWDMCNQWSCDRRTVDEILKMMEILKVDSIDSREKDSYWIIFHLRKPWWSNNFAIYRYRNHEANKIYDIKDSSVIIKQFNENWVELDWR